MVSAATLAKLLHLRRPVVRHLNTTSTCSMSKAATQLGEEVARLASLTNELTLRCVLHGVPLPADLQPGDTPAITSMDAALSRRMLPWLDLGAGVWHLHHDCNLLAQSSRCTESTLRAGLIPPGSEASARSLDCSHPGTHSMHLEETAATQQRNLTSLSLTNQNLTSTCFFQLLERNPMLRDLSLFSCSFATQTAFQQVQALKHLRGVHVSNAAVSPHDVMHLICMPSLRTLALQGPQVECTGISELVLSCQQTTEQQLSALDLSDCTGTDEDLKVCSSPMYVLRRPCEQPAAQSIPVVLRATCHRPRHRTRQDRAAQPLCRCYLRGANTSRPSAWRTHVRRRLRCGRLLLPRQPRHPVCWRSTCSTATRSPKRSFRAFLP